MQLIYETVIGINTFASTIEPFTCFISKFAFSPYNKLSLLLVLERPNPNSFISPESLPVFCKTVVWEEEVPYICAWKYPEFAVNLFRFGPAVRIKSPFLLNQSGTVNLDLHECLNRSLTQCNEEF